MDICKITFFVGYWVIIYSILCLIMAAFGLNHIKGWNFDTQLFVLLLSCIVVNTSCIAGKTDVKR